MDKLKNYIEIQSGYQIRSKIEHKSGGDIRIVQMKDVDPETGFDPAELDTISSEGRKPPVWLQKGDVLFVGRGYRNFAVLVEHQQERMVAAPQFFVLKADSKKVNPTYLTWFLNHRRAQQYFRKMSQSTSLPNITRTVLENCPFVLPSPEHQLKLAKLYDLEKKERMLTLQMLEKRKGMIDMVMDKSIDYK